MTDSAPGPDVESLLEHRSFVEALARTLVLDQHKADDLVQETLLAAMRNPPRQPKALRGWLARVVRNLAYRSLRTEERRRRRERRAARPEATPGTADLAARLSLHRRVVDALVAVDEPFRTTLLLRFYEDLQPKEIGKRLGIPGATVRTRLKRGLEKVRERLDVEHGGSRHEWVLALLPLAFATQPAATGATGGGLAEVGVMAAKKKILLAAGLAVALVGRRVAPTAGSRYPHTHARMERAPPAPTGTFPTPSPARPPS